MKKIRWAPILVIANLVAISWAVILFLNFSYPMVGHDYSLTIPSMLDTYLHYHINGLSIQWYTPTFGGGLPAFPDPNDGQFSLVALLPLLVNPWQAVIISSIVYITLGGIASYYFFKQVLKLHWTSSILGMVFFSANGFMLERIAVGHLGYQTFPVIAILVVLLLDSSIPIVIAGLSFSLVVAVLVYGAGYFLIVVFGLAILIILPLVYLYKPALFSWKRVLIVLAIGGIVALVLSASKLAAIYAFMRFFPRQIADYYPDAGILKGLFGIVFQLLGTMVMVPLLWAAKWKPAVSLGYMQFFTGAYYGYWEFDMSISPVGLGIIFLGIYMFLRRLKKYSQLFNQKRKWLAWILLAFFTWLTIEFILAKGWIYPLLRQLPILDSLHVNPRFTAAFIFPLTFLAAVIYNGWAAKWSGRKAVWIFLGLNVLALLPLSTFFLIIPLQNRTYDITASMQIHDSIKSGDTFTITDIVDQASNTDALGTHSSNLNPYDPIFGYNLEYFHPQIKAGSVWGISNGYYNMTNPSGYVFPELNGTRPFEQIPVSEKSELEAFVNHRQPDWKIPFYQHALDWISGLTFLATMIILAWYGIQRLSGNKFGLRLPIKPQQG